MKRSIALLTLLLLLGAPCRAAERDTLRMSFLGDVMMHYKQIRAARIPGADTTSAP